MTAIFREATHKLLALMQTNPKYWAICVERSQYEAEEILTALKSAELVNNTLQAVKSAGYDKLVDDDGVMDNRSGFATENHQKLYNSLNSVDYFHPAMSENDHFNCFPVAKWNGRIAKLSRQISKLQKQISGLSA